jgi:hypothetical protein
MFIKKLILVFSLLVPTWVFAAGPVDINTADAAALAEVIKGVGPCGIPTNFTLIGSGFG